jgi:hypothetical protein
MIYLFSHIYLFFDDVADKVLTVKPERLENVFMWAMRSATHGKAVKPTVTMQSTFGLGGGAKFQTNL